MLDKCFHVKTPSTWWNKRINNKKRNYNTVSHSYPVNLHEDIKKGGWGGWKKRRVWYLFTVKQSWKLCIYTISSLVSYYYQNIHSIHSLKKPRQIITSMCYKRKTKWEKYRNIWQKLLDHRFWHQWHKKKTLCLVNVWKKKEKRGRGSLRKFHIWLWS